VADLNAFVAAMKADAAVAPRNAVPSDAEAKK